VLNPGQNDPAGHGVHFVFPVPEVQVPGRQGCGFADADGQNVFSGHGVQVVEDAGE